MKKILLTQCLMVVVFFSYAQIGKNTIVTGLDLNLHTASQENYYSTGVKTSGDFGSKSISVTPSVGIFVSARLMLGINGNIGRSVTKDLYYTGVFNPRTTTMAIGPVARYYIKAGGQVYLFIQAEMTWGKTSTDANSQFVIYPYYTIAAVPPADVAFSGSTFQTGLRPGAVYFITSRIGLEATLGFLGFTHSKVINDPYNSGGKTITNDFGLILNSSTINLGFRLYFSRPVLPNSQ